MSNDRRISRAVTPQESYSVQLPHTRWYQHIFSFLTSIRFLLPVFVLITMTTITSFTIYLMYNNTISSADELTADVLQSVLFSVDMRLTGLLSKTLQIAVGLSNIMVLHGVPAMPLNASVSPFPQHANLFFDMVDMFSTTSATSFIYQFGFEWPSGRVFGCMDGSYFDSSSAGLQFWPIDQEVRLPNTTMAPLVTIPRSLFLDIAISISEDVIWRFNSKTGTFSLVMAVRDPKVDSPLGYLRLSVQLNNIVSLASQFLPTPGTRLFLTEMVGNVIVVATGGAAKKVYYNVTNFDEDQTFLEVGQQMWLHNKPASVSTQSSFRYKNAHGRYWKVGTALIDAVGAQMYVTIMIPEDDVLGGVTKSTETTIIICSVISAVCIGFVLIGTFIIGNALTTLQRNLRSVAFMGVDQPNGNKVINHNQEGLLVFSELRDTQESYITLHNAIKALHFYVPVNVVRGVLTGTMHSGLGMSQRFLVLSFQDIEKFTTLCEQNRNDPDKVIEIVSPMFEEVSRILTQRHGTIDKYIGDCIMTYWEVGNGGANRGPREACRNAVLAAHASLFVEPLHGVRFRTGIHCGMALLGNFGSAQRFNYTAVGDTVNTASRVESLNKEFHSQALCTERVVQHLSDGDESTEGVARLMEAGIECDGNDNVPPLHFTRYVGKVQVVGKDVAIGMYQIMKRPFEGGAAERQAWEDLIGRRLEKEHAFEAVSEVLNGMIPEEQDDPTLEYLRGQVMALHYVQQSGITSYDGIWKQTSK